MDDLIDLVYHFEIFSALLTYDIMTIFINYRLHYILDCNLPIRDSQIQKYEDFFSYPESLRISNSRYILFFII